MGFVAESNNKKIYAYLTEKGKINVLTGDTIDFEVKYFSLHDNDVNYYISSKKSNNIYNALPSGFIPDITGDDNICAPNTLNTLLKDILTTPIIVLIPDYQIQPDKISVNEGEKIIYTITTQNVTDSTLYWSYNGTTSSADFIEGISAGSTNPISLITNTSTPSIKSASFSLNVKNDVLTEGVENITVFLKNAAGDTLATAAVVQIQDTSTTIPTPPPLYGGVQPTCLNNGTDKLKIQIIVAGGGAGGPYKWKAVPIDSNGNLVFPYDPNIYITRLITETYDFPTKYINSNVFYKIYLTDSQGNQGLINTTTTICTVPLAGNLILSIEPASTALGATVGSHDGFSTNILIGEARNFDFIARLTKSDNSAITPSERNSVSFKLTKDLNSDNYIDVSSQFGPFIDTTVYSFSNNIEISQTNTIIIKRISLSVFRKNVALSRPAPSSNAIQSALSIKLKLNTVTGGPTVQNDTLTITGTKWIWN